MKKTLWFKTKYSIRPLPKLKVRLHLKNYCGNIKLYCNSQSIFQYHGQLLERLKYLRQRVRL